ncbi:MAG TPA: adenylyl-sulfate kinase [Ignavibacteriaceae bacterium]|nr:adenylyl-sulfate kinase [Ignavibacteriaceae bacterium]
MYKETKIRSVVKAITWRALATLTTMSLVFIFIGDMTLALSVGGIEVVLKMLIYFTHERVWDKIKWGKKEIKPAVIWLTGLVRSGKSEIGEALVEKLRKKGHKAEHLDGHSIRHLFPETGFGREAVNEHIKRVGYLAKKLEEQGVFVVASFVSPYRESREFVKSITTNFKEVHISTPLEHCKKNDTTGIYRRAESGEIKNLPGIDVEYEIPLNGALRVDYSQSDKEFAAQLILKSIFE